MSKVKFSRDARADLRNIDRYTYQTWGRAQVDKYIEMFENGYRFLTQHPTIGKSQDELFPGLRRYSIGKHYIFIASQEMKRSKLFEFCIRPWIYLATSQNHRSNASARCSAASTAPTPRRRFSSRSISKSCKTSLRINWRRSTPSLKPPCRNSTRRWRNTTSRRLY